MLLKVILMLTLLNAVKGYLVQDVESKEVTVQNGQLVGDDDPIPDWFDWRDYGMVTPVKNQNLCPACWAFGIVAAVESHIRIHLNKTEILSEQFLIDCTQNNGCNHASILSTMGYIVAQLGGILRDEDYKPYQDKQTCCTYQLSGPHPVLVLGFRRVLWNEDDMARALYVNGPLISAIYPASMEKYKGGIDEPTKESCDAQPQNLNHTVLVVGYGVYEDTDTHRMVDYWIIKNSWGAEWGEEGYYYLVRGKFACGIGTDVSFPYVN